MRAVLALALVLLALATGALAAPPKDARFELDEVEYLYITGVNRTETAVLEPAPDASHQLPVESCAFVQIHPGTPNGVVRVHGLQGGFVDFDLRVDQFRLPDGKRGYQFDAPVTEDGQDRLAEVAIRGNGSMRVFADMYSDPVSSTGFDELDRENPQMIGEVKVLRKGVRDDTTGAILAKEPKDDAELHVHVRSNSEATPASIVRSYESGMVAVPTQAYGASYILENLKFGGEATLDIASSSNAPAGMNHLVFEVFAPNGTIVANVTVDPALLADSAATATFALDALGFYTMRVTGAMALAQYAATVTMAPPPHFDLHLWWENVTYGRQAYEDYRACTEAIASPNSVIATERVIGRPQPPQFNVVLALIGVGGGIGVVTTAIKLASDQFALSAFRKSK